MIYSLLVILSLYAVFNLLLLIGWFKMPVFKPSTDLKSKIYTSITVVIPIRNEAAHLPEILQDLANQDYPNDWFEVFLVNDDSEDNSEEIIKNFIKQNPNLSFQLINLKPPYKLTPKKEAITKAIEGSSSDLIVCTDGDCRLPSNWLSLYSDCYQQTGAKFISGAVNFIKRADLFSHLQGVEFASLVGSGAILLDNKVASMCNGANLAYERKVFHEVSGFEGVGHIASGDDEFLLHKIAASYPKAITFLKHPQHIVSTHAPSNLWEFYQQRRRWSSKWSHYKRWQIKALALFVFLSNLAQLWLIILGILGLVSSISLISLLLLKLLPEYLFLWQILYFLKRKNGHWFIPMVQLFYPFYVVFFGILANAGSYQWKGRQLS